MRPYARAKQIFLAALDRPADTRAEFVASQCAGDDALQHEVMSLLAYHDEPAAAPAAHPERIGPYRVTRLLGEGGMGRVLLAEDDTGRPVALKLLRRELMSNDLIARFSREADALTRLHHAGIARLLGSGVQPTPAGPQHWLALEYVEGESLAAWAATQPSEDQRLESITQLCDAIQHAHEQGVVHRDLKPENVIVRDDGRPVLLDFGIARFTDAELRATVALTRTGLLMGTVRYMSPEQAEGRADDVGARSDQYSLAVMAYELLAGRLPYDLARKSVHSALATLMTAEPQPLTELRGPRRRGLERVLGKALEKAPESRYASVAEFADDLRRVREGRTPVAPARRRPLLQSREMRVTVVALAALLAAAAVLLVNARLAQRDVDTQWPRLSDELTRAGELSQLGARSRSDMVGALKELDSARRRLNALPPQPWTVEVRRLILFRIGEARLFLGRFDMDAEQLRASHTAFDQAGVPYKLLTAPVPLPDTSGEWVQSLNELTTTTAAASSAHALMELAELTQPGTSVREALDVREEARTHALAAVRLATNGRMDLPSDHPLAKSYVFRLNELAESRLAVSVLTDSAAIPPAALGELAEVMRRREPDISPSALASIQHNLGWAFLERARLSGGTADLDSAEVHLQAALGWRLTRPQNISRNVTVRRLAEVAVLRARRARTAADATAILDGARALLLRALGDVAPDAHKLHYTLLELSLADVDLKLAESSGDVRWLTRADSVLAHPTYVPQRRREPVAFAAHHRLLAQADAVAAVRFGRRERLPSLREHVQAALFAVPAEENPAQASALAALEHEAQRTIDAAGHGTREGAAKAR